MIKVDKQKLIADYDKLSPRLKSTVLDDAIKNFIENLHVIPRQLSDGSHKLLAMKDETVANIWSLELSKAIEEYKRCDIANGNFDKYQKIKEG